MPDAEEAAAILAPGRDPDRAEQAALDYVDKRRWVLWHAENYAAGVIRLLSHAGLLRDRAHEAEMQEAHVVMRRLADEDTVKRNREFSAALEEIERLRQELSLVKGEGADAR